MAAPVCSTCREPLSACQCPPPKPPDVLGRVAALERARIAALQWWCVALVQAPDPATRTVIWAQMQAVLEADARALAPWMRRQRRPKMDQATFLQLDAHFRQQRRDEGHATTEDPDIAAMMRLPLRTYARYKRGRFVRLPRTPRTHKK
jgi:hypothetical protein